MTQKSFSSISPLCRDKRTSAEGSSFCLKKERTRQIMNVRIHWGQTTQQAHCLLSIKRSLLVSWLIMSCNEIQGETGWFNPMICDVCGPNWGSGCVCISKFVFYFSLFPWITWCCHLLHPDIKCLKWSDEEKLIEWSIEMMFNCVISINILHLTPTWT